MKELPDYRKDKKRQVWILVNILFPIVTLTIGWFLGRFIGLAIGLLLIILICFVLGALVYNGSLRRNKKPAHIAFHAKGEELEKAPSWWKRARENMDIFPADSVEDVSLKSHDGLNLHGIFIKGSPDEKRTAIVLHYYRGLGMSMWEYAEYYHRVYGFNVLLADARGHGGSEGSYFGMGWHDRLDYLRWIDFVIKKTGGDEAQILLHGVSMGATTIMMLSGEELPKQVRFAVEDCGFTGIWELFRYQLRYLKHFPYFPSFYTANIVCRLRAGFWFQDGSSLKQVQKAKIPMIFVHGEEDEVVPPSMLYEVYEAAGCPDKRLIPVAGAGHIQSFEKDREGQICSSSKGGPVCAAIEEFVGKYMN